MQTIPIGDVQVPTSRQRTSTNPTKLSELKDSILREGLLHAIILTEGDELVAGATRLQAISQIYTEAGRPIFYDGKEVPFGQIPFTYTHKVDPLSLYRIELEENLRRENLSPIDEAQALAGLHKLLQVSAPELIPGSGLKTEVTVKETATVLAELSGKPEATANDQQKIADSILVDKYKDHPDVKRAKSISEAARLAKKAAERELREALGALESGKVVGSKHTLLEGDCALLLSTLPEGEVDVIIADPPYGIGADSFGEQSTIGHEYDDSAEAFDHVVESINLHANRVCRPDAALFMFLDIEDFYYLRDTASEENDSIRAFLPGWYIWPTPLIWHKLNKGHAPQPKRGPSRRYEAILYAVRGNREVRKTGSDVLPYAVPDSREHAAGKPHMLYSELLSWIAYPGDTVLDPCAGSGTLIDSAEALSLKAVVIEKDPAYITLIKEKLEKYK